MSQDRNQEEKLKLCRVELIENTTHPNLMGHNEGGSKRQVQSTKYKNKTGDISY